MALGLRKSKRFERVAALELPPGQWERAWTSLNHRDMLGRIALALLAALSVCVVIRAWDPPFAYRAGYTPRRNIVSAVAFTKPDPAATQAAQERARSQARYVYAQDAEPLVQLRAALRNTLMEVAAAPTLEKLEKLDPKMWPEFQLDSEKGKRSNVKEQQEAFQRFRKAVSPQESLDRVDNAVKEVFIPFEKRGLLTKLSQTLGPGNQEEILVYPLQFPEMRPQVVRVSDVLIGEGSTVRDALRSHPQLSDIADRLFAWLKSRLKPTLRQDEQAIEATKAEIAAAVKAVPEVLIEYSPGQTLAKAHQPLGDEQMELLRLEHAASIARRHHRHIAYMLSRFAALAAMIFAAFVLCGIYMRCRQRGPLASLTRLIVLMLLTVGTVAAAKIASDAWRAELLPVLVFGMTMAIVYRQELALLLTGVVALIVAIALGHGLAGFLLLMAVSSAAILTLGRIRTRTKLTYVGLFAGAVAALMHLGLRMVDDQPLNQALLTAAMWKGAWAVAAGLFMTGLLPFIEQLFGVLTDLSLLELGDVAHPLLQELVRRAPSTYNHSITVGSIAEAAAESIHARALLVRVGAYFHDIGKMLKPDYFVENQRPDENRHETLVPAMSTLVIIAHIKDGADLARQHRLPQPLIDLIAQHHGTTRVEFFYDRATVQQHADPNGGEVDESTYRYPGPKPQTKEAAVLMLADAVESASRSLVDPAPARIESLVRQIAEQRLHGGQFDESGLTLRELRTIEKSMVMSLASIYHGRIKYPDQRTA
ncbi:MAG: HDIG domain-containing protein [Planctomycetaceae bacterium]|nr:HDIG domain-containing protein [Planctomycetaceae bacterium]